MNRYLNDVNYGMSSPSPIKPVQKQTNEVNYGIPVHKTHDEKVNYKQEDVLKISLLNFIDNNIDKIYEEPPKCIPSKNSIHGPWVKNNIAYLSISSKNEWKHIRLYDNLSNDSISEGIYGSDNEIPVISVDSEGRIVSIISSKINLDLSSFPDTGVISGTYGGYENNIISFPVISVNEKGLLTKVTEMSVSIPVIQSYSYSQDIPSSTWIINHNMDMYPNVIVIDSSGNTLIGEIKYIDLNNLEVIFSSSFSGKAYLK